MPITPLGKTVNGGEFGPRAIPVDLRLENNKNIETAISNKLIQVAFDENSSEVL